ncbi:zinc finger domain-containing protein 22 [Sarcoptes scabiei]|uniref:Zinc finger domain-containing protein 22 n=1 Tax=Sarcoptes scabiei TaxID=52283 RepID=A0A132AKV2_SARSC|nr:zinc finger domain-containing protein 22 [Sarcoptes scabiei]
MTNGDYLRPSSPSITLDESESNINASDGRSKATIISASPVQIFNDTIEISKEHNLLPDVAQLSLESSASLRKSKTSALDMNAFMDRNEKNSSSSSNEIYEKPESFLLIDERELLQVKSEEEFLNKLGCSPNTLVKVVSIFGNTGEGKSHTLNYTFYDCQEVFHTSPTQNSCTIGIWCAYDRCRRVITIDTEGLLGLSENNNHRTRLLLKVLAISDVIIYRTRAERLHNDLFTFLGSASKAYIKHFAKELRAASKRCHLQCTLSDLGPVVIVFHETVYTDVLRIENDLAPEDFIRQRFGRMSLSTEAYSGFEYVGVQTLKLPTDFTVLQNSVQKHLTNSTVRSARTPSVIFNALKVLSNKFSGEITQISLNPFPDEYFTCSQYCLSCKSRCVLSINHSYDGIPHKSDSKCKYQHQYSNQIFYCRSCFERGEEIVVIPKAYSSIDSTWVGFAKYAWAGFVLECQFCGIIYRSRQYWYGNKEPTEQSTIQKEILHVWEDEPSPNQCVQQNSAQKMVDSMNYLSETMQNISAKPSKMIGDWMADQINPSYWVPNARIMNLNNWRKNITGIKQSLKIFINSDDTLIRFSRRCGGGFCEECSSKYQPVPERGWGDNPVRNLLDAGQRNPETHNGEITVRKMSEALQTTLGTVFQTIDYSLGKLDQRFCSTRVLDTRQRYNKLFSMQNGIQRKNPDSSLSSLWPRRLRYMLATPENSPIKRLGHPSACLQFLFCQENYSFLSELNRINFDFHIIPQNLTLNN